MATLPRLDAALASTLASEPDVACGGLYVAFGLAALSAVLNGTFGIFGKLCRKAPDPVLFNAYLTYGALLSSLVVLAISPLWQGGRFVLGFTWWGALCGALFVFATLFSFIAIPLAGLAMSAATWCCSAVLVAFLWGAVGPTSPPRQAMRSAPMSVAGVAVMIIGVLIINFSSRLGQRFGREAARERGAEGNLDADADLECQASERSPREGLGGRALGLLSAATVGLFGGSVLVPAAFVPGHLAGLNMLPSFGIGAALTGTLVAAIYLAVWRPDLSDAADLQAVRNGVLSGITWNLSNICQIIAQGPYHLSYGISYPILQSAVLFGGLWGIYFFKEETHAPSIAIFWLGAVVLVAGVVALASFGPGS